MVWGKAGVQLSASRYDLQVAPLLDILAGTVTDPESIVSKAPRLYFRIRRFVDVIASVTVLVSLLPLIGIVALVVLVDVGPPILFRQTRPGWYMRPFTLYKFRTMEGPYNADGRLLGDDERVSTLGHFLRRTRLDEIPQAYNVLVGDMSFIGPRPLLARDLPDYLTDRATIRPGISGWAQVNGGHQLTISQKIALDTWYVRHASLLIDLRIIYLTFLTMFLGDRINSREIERAMSIA